MASGRSSMARGMTRLRRPALGVGVAFAIGLCLVTVAHAEEPRPGPYRVDIKKEHTTVSTTIQGGHDGFDIHIAARQNVPSKERDAGPQPASSLASRDRSDPGESSSVGDRTPPVGSS